MKRIVILLIVLSVVGFGYLYMQYSGKNTTPNSNTTWSSMQYSGSTIVNAAFATSQDKIFNQIGDDCIEQGQTCTLNGTPCCSPYHCKGTFPNTTCQ